MLLLAKDISVTAIAAHARYRTVHCLVFNASDPTAAENTLLVALDSNQRVMLRCKIARKD